MKMSEPNFRKLLLGATCMGLAAVAVELPDDAVLVQQERAYTSPIWYTP